MAKYTDKDMERLEDAQNAMRALGESLHKMSLPYDMTLNCRDTITQWATKANELANRAGLEIVND